MTNVKQKRQSSKYSIDLNKVKSGQSDNTISHLVLQYKSQPTNGKMGDTGRQNNHIEKKLTFTSDSNRFNRIGQRTAQNGDISFQKDKVNVQEYINNRDTEMMLREGQNGAKCNLFKVYTDQSEQHNPFQTNNSMVNQNMRNSGSDVQYNQVFNSNRQSNESLFAMKTPFNNRMTFPNANGRTPMNQTYNTPVNNNSMPIPIPSPMDMNMNHNPLSNMNSIGMEPTPLNSPVNQNMPFNSPMNGSIQLNHAPLNLGKMESFGSGYHVQNQNGIQMDPNAANQQLIIDDYIPQDSIESNHQFNLNSEGIGQSNQSNLYDRIQQIQRIQSRQSNPYRLSQMKNEGEYEQRYINPLKVDVDPHEDCLQNYQI